MYKGIIGLVAGATLVFASAVSAQGTKAQDQRYYGVPDTITSKTSQRSYQNMSQSAHKKNYRYAANEQPKRMAFYGKDYQPQKAAARTAPKAQKTANRASRAQSQTLAHYRADSRAYHAGHHHADAPMKMAHNDQHHKKNKKNKKNRKAKRAHARQVAPCPCTDNFSDPRAYEKARMENYIDRIAPEHR